MLIVVGELYERVMIKRVRAVTECAIWEGQCGFMLCRGCMDQVAVKQVCEKYLANVIKFFGLLWIWKMPMIRSVSTICGRCKECIWSWSGGKLLKVVESFYEEGKACVRVGIDVCVLFPFNDRLRQGCVMSPWLLNE